MTLRSRPMGPGPTSASDFFLEMANSPSLLINRTFKSHQYLFLVIISRHEMESLLHNIDLKFPTHGSMTQIWVQFLFEIG